MAIQIISAEQALLNLRNNLNSKWQSFDDIDNRLWPIAKPGHAPSFRIKPSSTIYTIGSCFARNIESALLHNGFEVPTLQHA